MKFRNLLDTVFMLSVLISLILVHPSPGHSGDSSTEPVPVASGVYEGTVLEVEKHTLVVKQADGDIVRVRMPGKSGDKASDFQVGDMVEVIVTPEGITTSVKRQLSP